jgi:hypothetical protein
VKIHASAVADIQNDAFALGNLEAFRVGGDVVVADAEVGDDVLAVLVGSDDWLKPVSTLVRVILAPGTKASEGSVTVPTMVASWAKVEKGTATNSKRRIPNGIARRLRVLIKLETHFDGSEFIDSSDCR